MEKCEQLLQIERNEIVIENEIAAVEKKIKDLKLVPKTK